MKVVILAGGLGTRLSEQTDVKPKPMVEIGGKPMLWHIMKIYKHYGFSDFVICLGYKGEEIRKYLHNFLWLNSDTKITVRPNAEQNHIEVLANQELESFSVVLADTGEKTLKGGRLKRINRYLGDDQFFMATYGDGVCNVNIKDLVEFHKSHGKMVTLTGVKPPSRFGEIIVDGISVRSFEEKPQLGNGMINGGFFVFDRKIMDHLTEDEGCDLEVGVLDKLARDGEVAVYAHQGAWECMDTMRDVNHLNALWTGSKAFWKVWP